MSKIINSIKWVTGGQIIVQFFQIIVNVILARLLLPENFGLAMIVIAIIQTVVIISEVGFGQAIIQKKEINNSHLTTSFFINILISFILSIIVFILSDYIAGFYNEVKLVGLIAFSSLIIIIKMFSSVQIAYNERKFNFSLIIKIQIMAIFCGSFFKILFALNGFGIWSIIYGEMINQAIISILIWFYSSWYPQISLFKIKSLKEIFGFGSKLTVINLFNMVSSKLDILLIAKLVSSSFVGIYSLSLVFISFIPTQVNSVVQKVMYPTFSSFQNNNIKLQCIYLDSCKYISLISLPIVIGIGLISNEFINIFLGTKWLESVILIQILVIYGISNSLGGILWAQLLKARAKLRILLYFSIARIIFLIISILVGSNWGVIGIAWALGIYGIAFRFINQHFINIIISLRMKSYILSILPAIILSSVMIITISIVTVTLKNLIVINYFGLMIIKIIVGIFVYIYSLFKFYNTEFNKITFAIKNRYIVNINENTNSQ